MKKKIRTHTAIKTNATNWSTWTEKEEEINHDGQYYHAYLPEGLIELYSLGNKFVSTVDPLHKTRAVVKFYK